MNKKQYQTPLCDTWRFPDLMDGDPMHNAGTSGGGGEDPFFGAPARRLYL